MKAAENFYVSNEDYKVLDDELIVKYDSTTVSELWNRAENLRLDLTEAYEKSPRGIRKSLAKILPYLALYKTLLEDDSSDAYTLIAEQSKMNAIRDRKFYVQQAEKNPRNVIKLLAKTLKSEYSEKFGFTIIADEKEKENLRVRIVENPYEAACAENGCPELARIFYDRISYLFANLPGLHFKIELESELESERSSESKSEAEDENLPESDENEDETEDENQWEGEDDDVNEDDAENEDEIIDESEMDDDESAGEDANQAEAPKSSKITLSLSVRPA